jgi:hypothetical protein
MHAVNASVPAGNDTTQQPTIISAYPFKHEIV